MGMTGRLFMIRYFLGLLLLTLSGPAFATDYAFDTNKDGKPDKWYVYDDGHVAVEKSDLNFDGKVDCIVEFEKKGKKTHEELDNNYDGIMDTFFSYENGKLVLEEIDSNYDGAIDLRIYYEGIYALKYEQDTDFNGTFDKVKMFGPK
jgi:hypothetical protein